MPANSLLDAKDKAILYYLDQDARQSNSAIAKKTKLSKEVVNYRIKNLFGRGIIQNFCTIVDSSKMGYVIYRVFISFQGVNIEKEKEILTYLKGCSSIGWVVLLEEMYDMALLIWARNIFEFKDVLDEISRRYGVHFRKRLVTVVTNIHQYINNHLYGTNDLSVRTIGGKFENISLDETDVKILNLLAKDARTPLLNISKEIKVSPNTVKQRIKRMTKCKVVVGFRTKLNTEQLGYHHYKIFLGLADSNPEKQIGLKEHLRLDPNVVYVTEAIGRADLEFEIQVKNSRELHTHMKELRERFSSLIKDYRTTLVREEHTINYFPNLTGTISGCK